jgi:hypothetical protein
MRFGDSAICVHNLCLPFCIVTVLSYDRALSWTCIPEYKLVLKKKKKKKKNIDNISVYAAAAAYLDNNSRISFRLGPEAMSYAVAPFSESS